MSCRAIREKLNNALAAGQANAIERETSSHLQTCGGCRDYYEAQTKLYDAVDSGVRKLVENNAPASLLPGVRDRLSSATPTRGWIRALVPSTVALLVASGLLLLMQTHMGGSRGANEVASIQASPYSESFSSSPESEKRGSDKHKIVATGNHAEISRNRTLKPTRELNVPAAVIMDQKEAQGLASLASEIRQNPERGLTLARSLALSEDRQQTIEPLNITQIEIVGLIEESNNQGLVEEESSGGR
jgi:hypothetical protein